MNAVALHISLFFTYLLTETVLHGVLHIAQYTLHNTQCVLHIAQYTLHIAHVTAGEMEAENKSHLCIERKPFATLALHCISFHCILMHSKDNIEK